MRYFIIALASCLMAACGPVMASETTDQIKRACQIKENMDHPVCVKRAAQRAKMKASREAREQAQLDSILGRDPGAKSTH